MQLAMVKSRNELRLCFLCSFCFPRNVQIKPILTHCEGGGGFRSNWLTGLGQFPGLITSNTVIEDQSDENSFLQGKNKKTIIIIFFNLLPSIDRSWPHHSVIVFAEKDPALICIIQRICAGLRKDGSGWCWNGPKGLLGNSCWGGSFRLFRLPCLSL